MQETQESSVISGSAWHNIQDLTLEAAQLAAVQQILDEAGVKAAANELNGMAYDACKAGNIDQLWAAKGGCFATVVASKREPPDEGFMFLYGSHRLPDKEGRGQGGSTLLDLAITQDWSDVVQQTLRQMGTRRSGEPYKFKVVQLTLPTEFEDGASVSCLDLSGNDVCSVLLPLSARDLLEILSSATSSVFSAGQVIMPNGSLLQDHDLTLPLSNILRSTS
eukprot:TRINITY_DN37059_c0_g1_i1.p1 TRINITY_DN37059_c0_g1~~TRINITY_DN37059_c0_g1_i1.p1  ORF type:complete len:233 (-),score=30.62 TRINITY_DN37059_c0_g1_i1:90-752(-)